MLAITKFSRVESIFPLMRKNSEFYYLVGPLIILAALCCSVPPTGIKYYPGESCFSVGNQQVVVKTSSGELARIPVFRGSREPVPAELVKEQNKTGKNASATSLCWEVVPEEEGAFIQELLAFYGAKFPDVNFQMPDRIELGPRQCRLELMKECVMRGGGVRIEFNGITIAGENWRMIVSAPTVPRQATIRSVRDIPFVREKSDIQDLIFWGWGQGNIKDRLLINVSFN